MAKDVNNCSNSNMTLSKENKKKRKHKKKERKEGCVKEESVSQQDNNLDSYHHEPAIATQEDDDSHDENMHNATKNHETRTNNNNSEQQLSSSSMDESLSAEENERKKKKKKKHKKMKKLKKKRKQSSSDDEEENESEQSTDLSSRKRARSIDDIQQRKEKGVEEGETSRKSKKHKKKEKEKRAEKDDDVGTKICTERPIVESSAKFIQPVSSETDQPNNATTSKSAAKDDPETEDPGDASSPDSITLLLFYQYVEPPWTNEEYKHALEEVERLGNLANITGRMRVAKEGLNCTLTGSRQGILIFCRSLRRWKPDPFLSTEFKLTHHVPSSQKFPSPLKIMPVQELVHYGLEGPKAPPIRVYQGTHLEPKDYHAKMAEPDTVLIDVRNHYEANIGRFVPPDGAAEWVDPKMRKSTEFPVWLDKPETLEKLQHKKVLMYCTGGIRCERASALLKYKMEHDPKVKSCNIQGVFQLQGGIDKYFKEFPEGGYWKGKNYTFDKRCAHAPPAHELTEHTKSKKDGEGEEKDQDRKAGAETPIEKSVASASSLPSAVPSPASPSANTVVMGKCEGCGKAWDKYRGKRRCPTCGVPSLTCRECWQADHDGKKKLDKSVRCDLCVEQGIWSKQELRQREAKELQDYERKMKQLELLFPATSSAKEETEGAMTANEATPSTNVSVVDSKQHKTDGFNENIKHIVAVPNPDGVTRLYLRNMCRRNMNEQVLLEHFPDITHIVWRLVYHNKKNNKEKGHNADSDKTFLGQAWVEFATPEAAAKAVAQSGQLQILGRPLYLSFQPPNEKDDWPPSHSSVKRK